MMTLAMVGNPWLAGLQVAAAALVLSPPPSLGSAVAPPPGAAAVLRGQLMVGALFPVHQQPRERRSCGPVREMYGIQRVEATMRTIDAINRDPSILRNVSLGVEIRDSCWHAPTALQQAIEFIRDAISPAGAGVGAGACGEGDSQEGPGRPRRPPIVAVVGPASSSVSIQVQNLLQLFHIPQVGYSATSRDLSDKSRFDSFLRVVPSDLLQAQLMVDLLRAHNWTYVSAVNTDENYGQSGMQAFRELAQRSSVCIAKEEAVLSNASEEDFRSVVSTLAEDANARVVVCFCEGLTVRGLLGAVRALRLTGRFLFLGSDGWADRPDVTEGVEVEAQGSVSVRIRSPRDAAFDDYYLALNPRTNTRNPWFPEFWEARFNCVLAERGPGGGVRAGAGVRLCTGREQLRDRYKVDPKLSFIPKAILTLAHGLHNMLEDVCGPQAEGLCDALFPFNGSLFKNYLLNVSFPYLDEEVSFDRRGDPPGWYNILNYQLLPDGSYDYSHVGDWINGSLVMRAPLQYNMAAEPLQSVCSKPCPPGYYKNYQTGGQEQRCCWVCVPCDRNEVLVDDVTCVPCSLGYWPDPNQTECRAIPMEVAQWSDPEAVVAMAVAFLGLLCTVFTAAVFVMHNDSAVVKASTRELSYLILVGAAAALLATPAVAAPPSAASCAVARLLPGVAFALMYAALLAKTHRIARLLAGSKRGFPTRRPRFTSASAQVAITCSLVAAELAVGVAMLAWQPPAATPVYPSVERARLACNTTAAGVLAPLAFDWLLVALCTVLAVQARGVPAHFNEARFIGLAMYTTCVLWLAFVPIYFGSEAKVITMCLCVSLSSMVTVAFLFLPKLYIILGRPDKNTRATFTTATSIRCHIGGTPASASARSHHSAMCSTPSGGRAAWGGRDGDVNNGPRSTPTRSLSVQTGTDLLLLLLQSQGQWDELSPTALLRGIPRPHIVEESVSGEGGQLKDITIRLDGH